MLSSHKSLVLSALVAVSVAAYGDAGHGHKPAIGEPADSADAARVVEVEMTDNRYDHAEIRVRKGEVVRFVVHNRGKLVHEFNIGTPKMHATHQDEMLAMMQSGKMSPMKMMHGHGGPMGHHDSNSVMLNPGESGELTWRFEDSTDKLEFACNVPGHYQAGMVGRIRVDS